MYPLSDTTESDSNRNIESQGEPTEDTSGWDDDATDSRFELYLTNKKLEQRLVDLANNRISLASVLKKYEIEFRQQYSPSGWTHKTICPFKDHNEKTPSFGYNPQEERFYCFGCQRGGKAVQFISYMDNKAFGQVARELVKNLLPEEEIVDDLQNEDDRSKIFEILLDYASHVSEFTIKHHNNPKAIKYAESVSWPLDCYVRNHLPNGSIIIEQLLGRINILKEYLNEYK